MPIDPVTAIMLGGKAADTISNMISGGRSHNIALQRLALERMIADQQNRIATATRSDAYGNSVSYNPATNEFETNLSPTQQGLASAQQREQMLSLTEDATRNRDTRRRGERRARVGDDLFDEAVAERRYRTPPSEDALTGDITRDISLANTETTGQDRGTLIRSALRGGGSEQIPRIYQSAGQDFAPAKAIAQARMQARQLAAGMQDQHSQRTGQDISRFANIAGSENPAPIASFNQDAALSNDRNNMIAQVLRSISSGGAGVSSALADVGRSVPNPQFGELASGIAGLAAPKAPGAEIDPRDVASSLLAYDRSMNASQGSTGSSVPNARPTGISPSQRINNAYNDAMQPDLRIDNAHRDSLHGFDTDLAKALAAYLKR